MTAAPTVLVIDDDPSIVDVLCDALEDAGYRVLCALGEAALALARREQPDVILLDVMMPGMDGVEVSHHLRADPNIAAIPIIAMSAHAHLRQSGPLMQADEQLSKPFDLQRLYAVVARWIDAAPGAEEGDAS